MGIEDSSGDRDPHTGTHVMKRQLAFVTLRVYIYIYTLYIDDFLFDIH